MTNEEKTCLKTLANDVAEIKKRTSNSGRIDSVNNGQGEAIGKIVKEEINDAFIRWFGKGDLNTAKANARWVRIFGGIFSFISKCASKSFDKLGERITTAIITSILIGCSMLVYKLIG